jgi:hypothetical protein
MLTRLTPGLMAIALLVQPALALEDAASGLKVELPDDFIVEIAPTPIDGYDVLIGINAASGKPAIVGNSDYLCGVAFVAAPQNAGLTQDQITAMIDTPGWVEQARASMDPVMTFGSVEAFRLGDAMGAEFITTPRIGPDHDNVRLMLSMLETPKGRTVITCAATAATLKKVLPVFRSIRDGVTPPS